MQESGSHAPMNKTQDKEYLFERMSVPGAVMQLSLPIVISSLVTILYNLADTFFVGMLNNPVENAAVTLVYPVTLAFNAVNNLFGVGVSSAMSRNLGCKEYNQVRICSAFGFYGALASGLLFSLPCTVFRTPLLALLGTDAQDPGRHYGVHEMDRPLRRPARHFERGAKLHGPQ